MLTLKHRPPIERAIKRLVKAEIANSWIGSQHPEDYLAIKEELEKARVSLKRALDRACEGL